MLGLRKLDGAAPNLTFPIYALSIGVQTGPPIGAQKGPPYAMAQG